MKINQTCIKHMLYKHEIKDEFCPLRWKSIFIDLIKDESTKAQLQGQYFEYICGVNDKEVVFPGKGRGTKESLIKLRIDFQANVFKQLCTSMDILVTPLNTQIKIQMPYAEEGYICPKCQSTNISVVNNWAIGSFIPFVATCNKCFASSNACDWANFYLEGTIDILSPVKHDRSYPLANIDLKLTADINNDFGEFQWGKPEERDYTQAIMYHYIFMNTTSTHLHHLFLVFDHKPDPEYKIVPYTVSEQDINDLIGDIYTVVNTINHYNKYGWATNAYPFLCKTCPIRKTCNDSIYKN